LSCSCRHPEIERSRQSNAKKIILICPVRHNELKNLIQNHSRELEIESDAYERNAETRSAEITQYLSWS